MATPDLSSNPSIFKNSIFFTKMTLIGKISVIFLRGEKNVKKQRKKVYSASFGPALKYKK